MRSNIIGVFSYVNAYFPESRILKKISKVKKYYPDSLYRDFVANAGARVCSVVCGLKLTQFYGHDLHVDALPERAAYKRYAAHVELQSARARKCPALRCGDSHVHFCSEILVVQVFARPASCTTERKCYEWNVRCAA